MVLKLFALSIITFDKWYFILLFVRCVLLIAYYYLLLICCLYFYNRILSAMEQSNIGLLSEKQNNTKRTKKKVLDNYNSSVSQ